MKWEKKDKIKQEKCLVLTIGDLCTINASLHVQKQKCWSLLCELCRFTSNKSNICAHQSNVKDTKEFWESNANVLTHLYIHNI